MFIKHILLNIFFVFALFFFGSCSDNLIPKIEKQKITLVIEDTTFILQYDKDRKLRTREDRIYYFYFHQKIGKSQGGYLGYPLDGSFTSYTDDNILIEKGDFKKGLKSGLWYTWHANGNISSKTYWRKGKPIRKKVKYDGKGTVIGIYKWKKGDWVLKGEKKKLKSDKQNKEKKSHDSTNKNNKGKQKESKENGSKRKVKNKANKKNVNSDSTKPAQNDNDKKNKFSLKFWGKKESEKELKKQKSNNGNE